MDKLCILVLKLGSLTPFNFVTELSQYGLSLAISEVKNPKVIIFDNYQAFIVGTQIMLLNPLHEKLIRNSNQKCNIQF